MQRIVIFASGTGSNAENIINFFKNSKLATVVSVLSNNPSAKVLEKASRLNVATFVFNKNELNEGKVLNYLNQIQPDLIVLAGFLWMFPKHIINEYPDKVVNVHPALLPNYGGKGMYGKYVHEAVFNNKEKETGITIHYVNEHYDEGAFIFQKAVNIENCHNPEEIATKIHELEQKYFPSVLEQLIRSNK